VVRLAVRQMRVASPAIAILMSDMSHNRHI
jgi:hypothetical protein